MLRLIIPPLIVPLALLADAPTTAPTKTEQFDGQIVHTQGPLDYYVDNCARCHGPPENAYVARPKPKGGDKLRRIIKQMADDVAMAPLDAPQLAEQVKLHEAIFDNNPYVWIAPANDKTLAGEMIPQSEVELTTKDKRIGAKIENYRFVLPREVGEVTVKRNGHSTTQPVTP